MNHLFVKCNALSVVHINKWKVALSKRITRFSVLPLILRRSRYDVHITSLLWDGILTGGRKILLDLVKLKEDFSKFKKLIQVNICSESSDSVLKFLVVVRWLTLLSGNNFLMFSFVGWEETKLVRRWTVWFWWRWGIWLLQILIFVRDLEFVLFITKSWCVSVLFITNRDTLILFKRWCHLWLRLEER